MEDTNLTKEQQKLLRKQEKAKLKAEKKQKKEEKRLRKLEKQKLKEQMEKEREEQERKEREKKEREERERKERESSNMQVDAESDSDSNDDSSSDSESGSDSDDESVNEEQKNTEEETKTIADTESTITGKKRKLDSVDGVEQNKELKKPKNVSCTVRITGLSASIEDIQNFMESQCGHISEAAEDEEGMWFTFSRPNCAEQCLTLSGGIFQNQEYQVHRFKGEANSDSQDDPQLVIVKNLPYSTTEEDLKTMLGGFGTIVSVEIDYNDRGQPSGNGKVTYASSNGAQRLLDERSMDIQGRMAKFFKPIGKTRKLFVKGIPYSSDENELRETFEQYGVVTYVKIVQDRDTGESRGIGFVEFENHDTVESVLKESVELGGRWLTLEKSKERPPRQEGGFGGRGGDRRRGGRGGRGGFQGRGNRNGDKGFGRNRYFGGNNNNVTPSSKRISLEGNKNTKVRFD